MTTTTITLDGSLSDWSPVLADPQNIVTDLVGQSDPDNPPQGDRDITQGAVTWDNSNLYLYTRRSSSGSRAVQFIAYLDLNGDGIMENTDRVAYWGYNNSAFQPSKTGLAMYTPAHLGGDVMLGDGHTMPGFLGAALSAVENGAASPAGIEFESAINWGAIGVAPGSPIDIQFSAANTMNLPSGVTDNAGAPFTTQHHDFTFTPDRTGGSTAGATVSYTHTLTNTGNMADTYDLSAASKSGWPLQVLMNGAAATSVALGVGQSATITLRTTIPSPASAGSRDTEMVTARSRGDAASTHSVTDTTVVGPVTLVPDSSASMAPGQTVRYAHTLTNNMSQAATFTVTATSNNGWSTAVYAADRVTQQTAFRLAPGASVNLVVSAAVPSLAAVGTQDTLTVKAVDAGAPVTATAHDITTVRAGLVIAPNNTSPAGPGSTVTYWHTITNSWSTSRTVTLSAQSSSGWTTRIYDADGTTPVTSVTLGPNGATRKVCVRLTVPTNASLTAVDVTTLLAQVGTTSASASDRTTLARLATYTDGVYQTATTRYVAGSTVYARGMGIGSYSAVRFRWIDPTGRIAFTSPSVGVDVLGVAPSEYALAATDPTGAWQLQLLQDTNDTLIASSTFTVEYSGSITSLYATDATTIGSTVSVNATVSNAGSLAVSGSRFRYLLWWDQDSDGSLSPGDIYMDVNGNPQAYSGTGTPLTHVTQIANVPAGGSWSDSAWSISSRNFPNTGTWRLTGSWEASDGSTIDQKTTTFFAVPTLGWPLAGLTAVAGFALLYRRFRRTLSSDKA